jgi:hypothetical protein
VPTGHSIVAPQLLPHPGGAPAPEQIPESREATQWPSLEHTSPLGHGTDAEPSPVQWPVASQ